MQPTFGNKSAGEETTTQSNCDIEDKGMEERHIKQKSESSQPSSPSEKTLSITKQVPKLMNTQSTSMEIDPIDQDDQLESTKAEMGEVREENERLKKLLEKKVKDYRTLQMQVLDMLQQERKSPDKASTSYTHHQENEAEMVSLSLGYSSNHDEPKKSIASASYYANKEDNKCNSNDDGLRLGLECKFEHESTDTTKEPSSESNSQEKKEEEPAEVWPPSKVLKTTRSVDDEFLQQSHLKKPRVCVRTRCDTHTMNDGCQWRKYGQKIAKGNPCPRAYYRCTVSPNCSVRKQVQRYAQDMSILITTYEGTHNHPLPASATAMASTTSAAASMLQSRSSSSSSTSELTNLTAPTTLPAPLSMSNGLNYTFSQTSRSSTSPQFYIPNSSISTLNSHPTITIDLTVPPNNTASQYFNRFSSLSFPSSQRYSSTCLNFSSSSSSSSSCLDSNTYFGYGTSPYNDRHQFGLTNLARNTTNIQEQEYQPFMHMNNSSSTQSLTDTIAAATKVIAANPSFQSALAAALTSVVGNGGQECGNSSGVGSSSLKLKLCEALPLSNTGGYTFKQNAGVGCASSYNNKTPSLNPQQQGGLNLFPSSLPLFKSKSASGSSDDDS